MDKQQSPLLRFKSFTEEWERKKLGEIVEIVMGHSPSSIFYTDNPSDFILVQGNADIKNGKVCPRVWTTKLTKIGKAGDIVMSVRAPVGSIGKTDFDIVIGRGVCIIKGNEFIYQTLWKMKSDSYWDRVSSGSTFDAVNSNDVKNVEILIPSYYEEQTQIGNFFRNLDRLIAESRAAWEKSRQLKKAMLAKMFPANGEKIPKIRFKGFEGEWEICKLEIFGKATSGIALESEFCENGKYKVISIGSYSEESMYTEQGIRVNKNNKTEKRILNKNDLAMILNDKTSSGRIIGRVLLIDKNNVYVYNQRTQRIEINQEYFIPLFLYYLLNAENMRQKIISSAQGNTQIYVNWSSIKNLEYFIPSIKEEQTQIGNFFRQLDKTIALQAAEIEKLNQLKKAFLATMLV